MKKLFCLILLAVPVVLLSIKVNSADNRIKIGIVSSDAAIYGRMTSFLSKSSALQLIERRDLAPLFKEIELKQAGAVSGKTDLQLKGIDYLLIAEEISNGYSARIVRTDTGQILVSWTGTISELAQNCINKIESEVALKNLSRIENNEGIDVEINFSRDIYPAGSRIEFTVESSDDGFLYILDVQPDGNVYVLVPNSNTGPIEIEAGEIVELPGKLGFRMTAGEPYGIDTVKAIVTRKKINIFEFGLNMGKNYTEVKGKDMEKLSRGISLELESIPDSDWGIGSKEIRIIKHRKNN